MLPYRAAMYADAYDQRISARILDIPTQNPVPKISKAPTCLRKHPNAGRLISLLTMKNDDAPLIDKILELWKPRTWISNGPVAILKVLLRTCNLSTISCRMKHYKDCLRQLEAAAMVGNNLNWCPGTDYQGQLPSYIELEAIRILGDSTVGFGRFPSAMSKRIAAARLGFLLEDPADWRQKIDPLWINRVYREYPAISADSQGGLQTSEPMKGVSEESGFGGNPTFRDRDP
jgi:hypothetical protein